MNLNYRYLATVMLVFTLACNKPEEARAPENVIATYDGGTITVNDLDRAILAMPSEMRDSTPEERMDWYERLARDLAIGDILITEAKTSNRLEQPAFQRIAYHTARQIATTDYLQRNMPLPKEPPSEEALNELFKEEFGDGYRPARAHVRHIFLRYDADRNREALTEKLNQLRARILGGENFGQLATQYSDSESRHRKGILGFVEKKQLPEDLQKIVFSLEENTPSEPVFTKDGGHLFLVDSAIPEKTFTLDEVRQKILSKYWMKWQIERLRELVEPMSDEPDPYSFPSREVLPQLIAAGSSQRPFMAVGQWSITIPEFLHYVQSELGHYPSVEGWDFDRLYIEMEELALREWLYQVQYKDVETVEEPDLPTFEAKRNHAWSEFLIRDALLKDLINDPELLKPYYENNKVRFQLQPKVRLKILTVPQGPENPRHMGRMEASAEALKNGDITLAQLADELGGKVTETEALTAGELARMEPKAMQFAFRTEEGGYAPPFLGKNGLWLFKVESQIPPQPQPFTAVQKQVAEDYLRTQGQNLYQSYANKRLEAVNFHFFRENARSHGQLPEIATEPNE